jgi:DNA-binding NarL/FixJ family response regulator
VPVRVLLVDDQAMFVAAVHALLEHDDRIEIVGDATNGPQAIELADALRPDVALVDLDLPLLDGYETTRRLLAQDPALRVVVVSGMTGTSVAERVADAGATGYLFKGGLHGEIADAIVAGSQPLQASA